MKAQRFKTTLVQGGTRVCVPIPFNPDEVWGSKQRHHITGTVNGFGIRGPLEFDGSQYFLVLGAAWRRGCGLEGGAEVEVALEPEGPQSESLSPDISVALTAEPGAKAFFDSLATFYRKGNVEWIESAKRPETRGNRIQEMVSLLKAGKKQR